MIYINLIGKHVKYCVDIKRNENFQQIYKNEKFIIKGIDNKCKMVIVETSSGESWKLAPIDIRFLNNAKVKIF